ncbi:MAG: serine hydrolase domain-containing protein [Flavobacteriaceae bacterium]
MKNIIITLILNVFVSTIYCQTNDFTSTKLTEELEKIYTRKYINGFSVAIVNQDGILYQKGFGYSDIKTNKKYTNNTVQNIASISKTFIGIALLKAQELGKLSLDDPINKHLLFNVDNPHFPNEQITIRQLATHTSSIKDPSRYEKNGYILKEKENIETKVNSNFRSPSEKIALNEFLKNILSEDGKWYKKNNFLKTKPGAIFEYSNVSAGLAALIIEKVTNQSFNKFTNEHILKPLGMFDTGWSFNEIDFSKHSKLYLNTESELAFYQLANYPDGGLITSSNDLGKYLSELISGYIGNGKILNKQSYKVLFKPQLSEINFTERNKSTYNDEYNMGVFMGISAHGQIGHTGGDPGVATHMFFNSETKIGKLLIVNTNLKKEGVKEFIDIWKKLEEYETKL